ncbi:DUF937 domain-containing protein [Aquisphaera insulae]|uniref:DUF937 domain-containing protein n=1 Tax=Aquisphaera insulae TaxID=2712864 RepID=UPI0013E9F24D|nr:DUF937 domain-containing protein [Aquisphaera insulae]
MNIIDAIKGQVTGEVLSKISALLGESEDRTKSALGAAVPGLLALLSSLASTSGGADKLANALKTVDPSKDGNLGDVLSGPDLSSLQEKGIGWLSSLFGSAALPIIIGILGKFAGVGASQLKGLLGTLAPFILSMIAKQLSGKPLTSQTVSSFFEDQKANIKAALPPGLSFADVPGLGSLTGAAGAAGHAAQKAAAAARDEAAGLPGWLLPLVGVLVLGGLAWYFLSGNEAPVVAPDQGDANRARVEPAPTKGAPVAKSEPDASKSAPVVTAAPVAPAAEAVAQVSTLTKDLGSAYTTLAEILGSVKDGPTAEASLPKLTDLSTKVDGFKGIYDKLNEAGKAAIAKIATEQLGKLKDVADTVLKVPGLSDKFKEILQAILTKLAGFKVG